MEFNDTKFGEFIKKNLQEKLNELKKVIEKAIEWVENLVCFILDKEWNLSIDIYDKKKLPPKLPWTSLQIKPPFPALK